MRKYWHIFISALRESVFYRSKTISSAIIWLTRTGILIIVYSYAFRYVGHKINGIDFSVAAWSMAIYFIIISLDYRTLYRDISDDIRLGTIEYKTTKPYSYIPYMIAQRLGKGIIQGTFVLLLALVFLFYIAGFPHISLTMGRIVASSLIFVTGITLGIILYSIVGLCAIWIQDSDPVMWIVDKSIMVLGGSFVPVAFFSPLVRTIAETTPMGATMFTTQIFNPDFADRWLRLFIVQIIWVILFFLLLVFMYKKANKKLSVNGG